MEAVEATADKLESIEISLSDIKVSLSTKGERSIVPTPPAGPGSPLSPLMKFVDICVVSLTKSTVTEPPRLAEEIILTL